MPRVFLGISPMDSREALSHPLCMASSERGGDASMSNQEAAAPSAAPTIRKLTRRRDNKVIAGVCSGLGDYTGLDPIIFRLIFVVMAELGGSRLLLYGIAWLLIPEAGSGHAPVHRVFDRFETTPWIGVGLVILGAPLLLSQMGRWNPPIVWGCALLVLGFILFRQHESSPPDRPGASSSSPSGSYGGAPAGSYGATPVSPATG